MTQEKEINIGNLKDALSSLPLNGRHLIEASAGTGKTFNITKLYVRLLLEKGLSVQQILVMTFTKAATEELRGRIEKELRNTYEKWDQPALHDDFLRDMVAKHYTVDVKIHLKQALLSLDDASIFTIHGFCNRVLSQEAFASGLPMELRMEADSSVLLLEAVRDWLRGIGQNDSHLALLQAKNWHTPEGFINAFKELLTTGQSVTCMDADAIQEELEIPIRQGKQALADALLAREADVLTHFIGKKKGGERQAREDAWQCLKVWMTDVNDMRCPEILSAEFTKRKINAKHALSPVMHPVIDLLALAAKLPVEKNKRVDALPLWALIEEGITTVRMRFAQAKSVAKQLDFNDLISHLAKQLSADKGEVLADILRSQYPVALVDEFQDTDPEQFTILDHIYPQSHPEHALFMIGDPKQAIYSFRGGDVFAYLQARDKADAQWHMDTNWRSVPAVVNGYNRIFYGKKREGAPDDRVFGWGIQYDWIHHSEQAHAAGTPLTDESASFNGLNFIWLPEIQNPTGKADKTGARKPLADDWFKGMTNWCVSEIHRLLTTVRLGEEPVQEQDIAILVRSANEAARMRQALQQAGYPSVYLSDRTNVFDSPEAKALLDLLQGVLDWENDRLLIRAVASRFWGGDAATLTAFTEDEGEEAWESARNRAMQLRERWRQQGCMSMVFNVLHETYVPDPDTRERSLTNIIQLVEQLQQAARRYKQPLQLLKWYQDQCLNVLNRTEAEQRLESDAKLIRIITQHGSKGLEYPVVFVPYATTYQNPNMVGVANRAFFKYHDPDTYALQVCLGHSDQAKKRVENEGHAESVRLFYVALTRASHRCYMGLWPGANSCTSGAALALQVASEEQWEESLQAIADTSDGCIHLHTIESETALPRAGYHHGVDEGELQYATLNHTIDDNWRLASYSTLKKLATRAWTTRQDEKDRDQASGNDAQSDDVSIQPIIEKRDLPLRFRMKKGHQAGDLLHDILEHTHFAHPQWDEVMKNPLKRFEWQEDDKARFEIELQQWLQECLEAPIPVLANEADRFRLLDLSVMQTVREAEFYFPMAQVNYEDLETLLQQHRGSHQRIDLSRTADQLSGMMHGFIDLIFEYDGRYYVADYKSNHLGDDFNAYDHNAMLASIQENLYDLQYLIYALALHRYLGARLGEHYQPEQHFGGIYYFYLRGMSVSNEQTYGIYGRSINADELRQLDTTFGHADKEITA